MTYIYEDLTPQEIINELSTELAGVYQIIEEMKKCHDQMFGAITNTLALNDLHKSARSHGGDIW